ncbi:MAG TPA: hypothetical protein DHV16_01295 [Nitrospiraceae bacterium]|nr:MAG: hypothetical protein A2Z82_09305 [Nitrospirae bacterium GWA2_46_11]OGW24085.1 MAG: hypothetical protein A2X55_10255 [Nitrospirae bacterium GWB2_47_37]HAK88707.1 hypothetical protein [Nitrospiraceae bacterium]HCL81314.1 hypothetical protein [Nitrospiraceae bacterium]HCZ10900.1 hypothetical protein [Nitrospiraceae bacterium]
MECFRYNVLIVDDEEIIKSLLVPLLSSKGHICETASNGKEAFDKYRNGQFDAVITDIVMPEMDGLSLTEKIRSQNRDMPIMIMTGFTDTYSAAKAVDAGASEFISKPFSVDEFLLRFQRMMRDRDILCRIREREAEIQKISTEMIAGMQKDSTEQIGALRKELEELNNKLGGRRP